MMRLLRQIFTQLVSTFKLVFLLAKSAKNGNFQKGKSKKNKSSKSNYSKSIKWLKSSLSKKVVSPSKRVRSKLLMHKNKISKLAWQKPITLFSVIAAVLGLGSVLAWYKVTSLSEPPVYTLTQDQPAQAAVAPSSPIASKEYEELAEPVPTIKIEAAVNTAVKKNALEEKPVEVKAAEENPPVEPERLQPYFMDDETPVLIKTINPQFLVEVPPTDNQRVSIVLTGLGINKQLTQDVLDELQDGDEVTLVFSPYAEKIGEQIFQARQEGYTTLLTMPLEDDNAKTDQGFLTLRTKKGFEPNLQSLGILFNLARECEGFYGEGGNRFLRSAEDLKPFAEWLVKNKNLFLAPPDVLMTRLHEISSKTKLNYACTTIIDPPATNHSMISSLAKRTGFAIVAFKIKPGIVDEINEWIINLEADNINVVPITEIIPIREKR